MSPAFFSDRFVLGGKGFGIVLQAFNTEYLPLKRLLLSITRRLAKSCPWQFEKLTHRSIIVPKSVEPIPQP
ncbi:MAG: hypothetical protein ACR2M4_13990 [Actinomycetota bacterium]